MKGQLLGAALMFALSSSTAIADNNSIVGTWRVQSFVRGVVATGERQNEFGEKPNGYIIYQPDGRMFFMLVGDNRAKPAGTPPSDEEKARLFGTLIAYSGTYVAEGDRATHKVDLSWNQSWTGGDQVRFFKVDGTTLTITTAINTNPRDGREGRSVLVFTKTP
jgi:Lipocalin-like domain